MGNPVKTPSRILENIQDLAHDVQILANILSIHCPQYPDPHQYPLNSLRRTNHYDEQIIVIGFNSWCRCPTHNKNEDGATNSVHMTGGACDLRFYRRLGKSLILIKPEIVCRIAYKLNEFRITSFGGIGCYHNRTHLDIRKKKRVIWVKTKSGDYVYGVNFTNVVF